MNRPQRIVLFAAAALMALLTVYGPHLGYWIEKNGGLKPEDEIWQAKSHDWNWSEKSKVDFQRLGLEAGGVLAVTILLVFALKKPVH
jgi:hypothetical protein